MKKLKIILPILLVAVLVFAFWYGGDAPGSQGWEVEKTHEATPELETSKTEEPPIDIEIPVEPQDVEESTQEQPSDSEDNTNSVPQEIVTDPEEIAPVSPPIEEAPTVEIPEEEPEEEPEPAETPKEAPTPQEPEEPPVETAPVGNPLPVNPEDTIISDTLLSCTLSVRCDTILNHMDWLTPGKEGLVPVDGVIYGTQTVQFYEGESVFNVLLREMKRNKIHMEYENTPLYNSAYIQGINNLYEFDAGELSGWNYKVNGWFPNYGCSRYVLQDGDVMEWVYSCDLGQDVGGGNAMN